MSKARKPRTRRRIVTTKKSGKIIRSKDLFTEDLEKEDAKHRYFLKRGFDEQFA